ncbi:MAG: STAS domain-containing protein [Phycisphaerae bacterium]
MATDRLYETNEVDGVIVVTFRQSQILDAMTIERMSSGLKELIGSHEGGKFIFDFSQVTYMSSSALGMLIGLQRRVAQKGARLKLTGIQDEIMEVFRITQLDTVFDIYKDTDAAVEAFRKNL